MYKVNTFMKEQEIKNISQKIRRCQRNWQLDKSLPQQHIELLAEIAKHSPSKQDEAYFDVYVITQRSLIETLYNKSDGFTAFEGGDKPENLVVYKNSQSRANAVFLWCPKDPATMRNYYQPTDHLNNMNDGEMKEFGTPKDPNEWTRKVENTYASIGVSMGCTSFAAGSLGYATGFNKSHGDFDKYIGIPQPRYSLGIGFPLEDKPHNIDNEGKTFHSFSLEGDRDINVIHVTDVDGSFNKEIIR